MVIGKQVLNQYSPGVEPYFGPRVMGIGVIVVVGAGVEDIGCTGAQAYFLPVEIYIAMAVCDIFKYIVISVGAHNMIIGVSISNA